MTPLHQRGPTQKRRGFLKSLAGLTAVGCIPRHTGSLYGAQLEPPPNPLRLIVDADTANEIDDAFALARALMEPRFQIEGITSAQWHTQEGAPRDTVGLSQEMNEKLWSPHS